MNQAVEVPLQGGYLKVECFFIGGRYCQSKWFYTIDQVEVMPSHWKKIPKIVFRIDMPMLSKSLTCASFWVEEEFVRKLLMNSIRGICVIILSVPVPVNGNSSGVLPGLHIFEKFPDLDVLAKFYDSFINHEINNGSLWLSRLFTCSSLQHMVVDHQGPWAQCQNELNSETSQVFSFATSLNGLI